MSRSELTRRSLMAGAAAIPVATVPALPALSAPETITQHVNRLCREVSEALNDYADGHFRAIVSPSQASEPPVWFQPINPLDTDAELVELGRQYDAAAEIENELHERVCELHKTWKQTGLPPTPRWALVDEWVAARQEWERESGYGAANSELQKHCERSLDPLGRAILRLPAATVAGLAAKAKVAQRWLPRECYHDDAGNPLELEEVDDFGHEVLRQFVEEVIALGDPEEGAQS